MAKKQQDTVDEAIFLWEGTDKKSGEGNGVFRRVKTGDADDFERIKEKILEESKRVFKPEFLNRINELVVFRSLNRDDLVKIVDIELKGVINRLKSHDIVMTVSEEAKGYLIDKGFDEKYGARPLRRAVERHIEDPLAEAILRGDLKKNEPITVVIQDGEIKFDQQESSSEVKSS